MSTSSGSAPGTTGTPRKHTAGAFDIRNFIGLLLAIYGVVLTAMGLFGDKALAKTGGVNANLWAGIVLLLVGIGFMAWARLRPVVVDEAALEAARQDPDLHPHGH